MIGNSRRRQEAKSHLVGPLHQNLRISIRVSNLKSYISIFTIYFIEFMRFITSISILNYLLWFFYMKLIRSNNECIRPFWLKIQMSRTKVTWFWSLIDERQELDCLLRNLIMPQRFFLKSASFGSWFPLLEPSPHSRTFSTSISILHLKPSLPWTFHLIWS